MFMQRQQLRTRILAMLRKRQGLTLSQIVLRASGTLFGLQVITIAILQFVSKLRKKRRQSGGFPHPNLNAVCVGDNTVHLYDYGQYLYDAMLSAIDNAQESIYLETFIWKDDKIGQMFKEHLTKKAAQGLEVYVVFDSFGNAVVAKRFKEFPPSIHTLKYQAIRRPWHIFDPRRYALEHRKLLVVDGYTSFIGGYNIGSLYADTWRDTHLCIQGPTAADLAHSFSEFWNQHDPGRTPITRHYPRRFDPLITIGGTNALQLMFPIRDMYIRAIDRAERTIRLTNAYFVPDGVLLDALVAAARRNVDVQILVPWISNHIVVDWLARGYFTQCLRAGIKVFGYRHMLHAKTCTIDGQWSTIGTANLDRLSSVGNYEINVEVYSEALAHQMEQLFLSDTTDAIALSLDEWLHRPWYALLGERILAPLRLLL
ncbi:MAG: phospholipase D-like domain-containing protein [Ktedonobacteraceae bacterium]